MRSGSWIPSVFFWCSRIRITMDTYSYVGALEAMGAWIVWMEHEVNRHEIYVVQRVFVYCTCFVVAYGDK